MPDAPPPAEGRDYLTKPFRHVHVAIIFDPMSVNNPYMEAPSLKGKTTELSRHVPCHDEANQ